MRFIGVGPYSLDVEVIAYVTTSDYDEFVALQQELLLKMLQAVEEQALPRLCGLVAKKRRAGQAARMGLGAPVPSRHSRHRHDRSEAHFVP